MSTKKSLKLGYFSISKIGYGETFIYDLVKAFSTDPDIDVTYITGASETLVYQKQFKTISTGFSSKHEKIIYWFSRFITPFIKNGTQLTLQLRKKVAISALKKKVKIKLDFGYIDYATSAILIYEYFEKKDIPFILHIHGYDITSSLNNPAYRNELPKLFEKSQHIISPSNHLKRVLITLGANPKKITTIYPVTDLSRIEPVDWNALKLKNPTLTFLGRLTEKKNPIALIHAFKIVSEIIPNITLNIIGGGNLQHKIENLITEFSLNKNVFLIGAVNRETAFKYLKSTWVYVQHSVTAPNGDQEGFPVSLAEAAAHAIPIVSTIHSGITENVKDGVSGYLVQEYDFEEMAKKIIYLIHHPEIAEKMGKVGRKHILEICEPGSRSKKIKQLIFGATID